MDNEKMKNGDLFNYKKPRKKREVMAHMDDGGQGGVLFKCLKCGWGSGWITEAESWTTTKILRGVPCQKCNI